MRARNERSNRQCVTLAAGKIFCESMNFGVTLFLKTLIYGCYEKYFSRLERRMQMISASLS